ncbi:MAG: hypothetical protein CR982_00570 [Candidatus Cloacimonadota bacterium]|nr:MAG: hypothetical protein CR982_00570 [Candidatus Cloacimonadota bacterium]
MQNFSFSFDKVVKNDDYLDFDPNNWILCTSREIEFNSTDEELIVEPKIHLAKNYPNPFNNQTTISFVSNFDSNFQLLVFNQAGQEVYRKGFSAVGGNENRIKFNAQSLNSGVYFYQINDLERGLRSNVRKMLYIK